MTATCNLSPRETETRKLQYKVNLSHIVSTINQLTKQSKETYKQAIRIWWIYFLLIFVRDFTLGPLTHCSYSLLNPSCNSLTMLEPGKQYFKTQSFTEVRIYLVVSYGQIKSKLLCAWKFILLLHKRWKCALHLAAGKETHQKQIPPCWWIPAEIQAEEKTVFRLAQQGWRVVPWTLLKVVFCILLTVDCAALFF